MVLSDLRVYKNGVTAVLSSAHHLLPMLVLKSNLCIVGISSF